MEKDILKDIPVSTTGGLYTYRDVYGNIRKGVFSDKHQPNKINPDPYQERYIAHQARKRDVLIQIMQDRHSTRIFADTALPFCIIEEIKKLNESCPSSCDRRGVSIAHTDKRDDKALLSGLLVGGTGWIHRSQSVFLLFAEKLAYKAGSEIDYMPYLDAGCIIQSIYLYCSANDLKCCFCNPNIRENNKSHFYNTFAKDKDVIFCGAMAIGYEAT